MLTREENSLSALFVSSETRSTGSNDGATGVFSRQEIGSFRDGATGGVSGFGEDEAAAGGDERGETGAHDPDEDGDAFAPEPGASSSLLSARLGGNGTRDDEDDFAPAPGPGDGLPLDDSVRMWLREIGKTHLLSMDQEIRLAKRVERGDLEAKLILVEANLRLVVSIAKRYAGRGMSFPDLIKRATSA
jgi:hypothetical protein